MIDVFYTPPHLAELMMSQVGQREPTLIADFAVGDGELLQAAHSRWNSATFLATDIDPNSIRRLKRRHPGWQTGTCDFLAELSRSRCRTLRDSQGQASLVLLNPPFSYRGGTYYDVKIGNSLIHCTKAMAFVANALPYMTPDAELLAILPAGTLGCQKDAKIWSLLNAIFDVSVVSNHDLCTFALCRVRTILVRFTKRAKRAVRVCASQVTLTPPHTHRRNIGEVAVIRGVVQMHTLNGHHSAKSLPLVHTTDLSKERLNKPGNRTAPHGRILQGPAVLLPRVGEPSRTKIVLYPYRKSIILSDCVIGLRCQSRRKAKCLQSTLKQNWSTLERAYTGTCAKYVTLSALQRALSTLDIQLATPAEGKK